MTDTTLPSATCPDCGKTVALTNAGRFRAHGDGVKTTLPFQERCKGAGMEPPETAPIRQTLWWKYRKASR